MTYTVGWALKANNLLTYPFVAQRMSYDVKFFPFVAERLSYDVRFLPFAAQKIL